MPKPRVKKDEGPVSPKFQVGDRVIVKPDSPQGQRLGDRQGTIHRYGGAFITRTMGKREDAPREEHHYEIRFDGRKTVEMVAESYLVRVPPKAD